MRKPAIRRTFLLTKSEEEEAMKLTLRKAAASAHAAKQIEPQFEELLKAERTEREKLQKALDDERDLRLNREFIQKAKEELGFLPLAPEKLGPVIKAISAAVPEAWKELEPVLKGASELIGKSEMFTERGRPGVGSGGDAWQKIEAAARGLIEKAAGQMNHAEAISRAIEANPALYTEYDLEREEAARR